MLDAVKAAMSLTTDAYDAELTSLIAAAVLDLQIAGIAQKDDDALYARAVITYCRAHFKSPDDYDRLIASYDAQKGAMQIASGYTNWGDIE